MRYMLRSARRQSLFLLATGFFAGFTILSVGRCANARPSTAPIRLSCDSMQNPLGIDNRQPRLSWQMPAIGRDVRQSAYEILVSTTPNFVAGTKPNVWDSGRVSSDQSVNVIYTGPALQSRQRYYWRVQVWDRHGKKSAPSASSWWEMGLLSPSDWRAQWIANDPKVDQDDRKAAPAWIWVQGEKDIADTKAGKHQFRLSFHLPQAPTSAVLFLAAKDNVSAWANGRSIVQRKTVPPWDNPWDTMQKLSVGQFLQAGNNSLSAEVVSDKKKSLAGFIALLRVRMPDGTILRFASGPEWKAAYDAPENWLAPDFDDASWHSAVVVAKIGVDPLGRPWPPEPAKLLRDTFTISKQVRSARLYATALGSYQFHLNGKRVGDQILAPGWTDYRQHIVYQTYDVTALLHQGKNAIGALLGDGWYATGLFGMQRRYNYGAPPLRLLAQLEVTYTDGTRDTIVTDSSWKTTQSAVLSSEIYNGETYDARLEKHDWDLPTYSDASWSPVRVMPGNGAELTAQDFQPIRIEKVLHPIAVLNTKPGVYVFDMGQNMVGWARLHVRGPKGTRVQMRFGEVLDANGQFYNANMRSAKETDTFILNGNGAETFQPHFTYHGFRYIEVTGYPGTPTRNDIEGLVFHTDAPFTIQFHSGNRDVNQLWSNILWGQRGNFESIPTDCPQRDERLGWMGDAEVFWRTATFNANLDAFAHKFTRDIREAQMPSGAYADYSPGVDRANGSTAGWADAGIIIPWTTYIQYGDTGILEENWTSMQKWMNHLETTNPNYLWLHDRGGDYGDWLAIGSVTSKDLIATAYWAYDASLMSKMATVLGKTQDAEQYRQLFAKVRDAFDHAYVQADGTVGNGSQTSYVLALHMQLLPVELRAKAAAKLVADIKAHQWHLTTGFLGTPYLMIELSNAGYSDVAYRLLASTTYPSWGYMVRHGATTMWERWNGNQMLNDPTMNSFNHYAYGAVGEWLYRYMAGIDEDPTHPGFQHILLHPQFDAAVGNAGATYQSPYGSITSDWKYVGTTIVWNVVVPPNTTAQLQLPAAQSAKILEIEKSPRPLSATRWNETGNGMVSTTIGSGTYRFAIRQK